jgi:hypothetical protein
MLKGKTIIAISKDKVVTVRVLGSKIKTLLELGWTSDTLDIALAKVKEKIKKSKVMILVSDELSYVLRLSIPKELRGTKEKDYIADLIKEQVPEMLKKSEWDYKDLKFTVSDRQDKEKKKDVIIFALVKDVFEALTRSINKIGISVEAIEPEVIAKTRDANPIIGLAKKKDIKGKDQDVLNLELVNLGEREPNEVEDLDEEEVKKELEEKDKLEKTNTKLKIVMIILFLTVLAIGGYLIYVNSNKLLGYFRNSNDKAEEKIMPSPTETVTPTASPTPVAEVSELSTYKLLIENGSGEAGEADNVADILTSEGFSDIETANADAFDYVETQISLKAGLDDATFSAIERALNSDYPVASESGELDTQGQYDIVVIVGQRR